MVEFGLKLADNKVADWSESYIHYEKLKQILKKCEADQKRYDDLAAKDKALAESIRDKYEQGFPTTPQSSSGNLVLSPTKKVSIADPIVEGHDESTPPTEIVADEGDQAKQARISRLSEADQAAHWSDKEFLLKESSQKTMDYGSAHDSGNTKKTELVRSESGNSLRNFTQNVLEKATSGVSGYFKKSFERQVQDALKAIDKDTEEFGNCLQEDLTTVNTFYGEKLFEIQGRLHFLKDTVAQSRAEFDSLQAPPSPSPAGRDYDKIESQKEVSDSLETPLIQRRKSTRGQLLAQSIVGAYRSATSARRASTMAILKDSMTADDGIIIPEKEGSKKKLTDEERAKLLREAESTQRALVDLYRTAKLLHNFAILNFTGFVKIVKKFNKTLPQHKGRFKQAIKPENVCDEGKAVEALADRMVVLYANWFCGGSKSEAQVQIMPKKGDSLEMDWTQLRFGYRMGMCTILGLWVCWDCLWGLFAKGHTTIGERSAFPVFRACAGLLLLQWFWGVSVWVWTRFRINYIYLFDFNPHIVDSPLAIFNAAVDHTLFYLIVMLLYYKAGAHDLPGDFPAGIFPFLLVIYACINLIVPVRTRFPMWGQIWRVVTAPAYSPSFFQGYIGDIFTSMVKVFQDMAWAAFFVFSGDWMISEDSSKSTHHRWSTTTGYKNVLIPLITLLPLWFRFNQCLRRYVDTRKRLPHLANAFKYALSQMVTLFGAFHPLYLDSHQESKLFQRWWWFFFVGSSLYSFVWDVYMDWGLGLPKYNFLGPRLMYPNRAMYYAIIAADLVLRFAWVLTLIPPGTGASFALPNYLAAVSMILELGRRTVWGFLRLENEHRSNTAGYRRVNFVPLHFTTGHKHDYAHDKEHRGVQVLLEVAFVTVVVLAACVVSVVAAQHATDRVNIDSEL